MGHVGAGVYRVGVSARAAFADAVWGAGTDEVEAFGYVLSEAGFLGGHFLCSIALLWALLDLIQSLQHVMGSGTVDHRLGSWHRD